jgi:hypothetical protein
LYSSFFSEQFPKVLSELTNVFFPLNSFAHEFISQLLSQLHTELGVHRY